MKQQSKLGKALLKLATIAFFLNATFAYGACCLPEPTSLDTAATEMPCHHEEESTEKTSHDNCCATCVSLMVTPTIDASKENIVEVPKFMATAMIKFSDITPPFRPPITRLS